MDARRDQVEGKRPDSVFSSRPTFMHGTCETELCLPLRDLSYGSITTANNHFHDPINSNDFTGAGQLSRSAADGPFHVYQAIDLDAAGSQWGGASAVDAKIPGYDMKWAPSVLNGLHSLEDFSVPTTTALDATVSLGPAIPPPLYFWSDTAGWTTGSDATATGGSGFNNGNGVAFDNHLAPADYDCFYAIGDLTNPGLSISTDGNTIPGFQYGMSTPLINMPSRMTDNVAFHHPPAAAAPVSVPLTTRSTTRFRCIFPGCGCTITQNSDLSRHARKHEPDAKRYECWARGCTRNGKKGFLRRDKLQSHQRNMHGMES